jgi:4-nitrophenyl phosphatase
MLNISTIKGLILDMDGVLWRGSEPIGNLSDIFSRLQERGWKITLATNNATRTISQYVERLQSYGVIVEPWQIINSAIAVAQYLHDRFPQGGPVYSIGETGLIEALDHQGFYQSDEDVIAVIASMDRQLSYEKLRKATLLIRGGAPFIATNPDRTFPTPEGLVPGAGSILAALEAACYKKPVITGKPSPAMYQIALARLGLAPCETLVVGDRPETDIAGAQAIGCRTALVLSGVTSLAEANIWHPTPDLIINDLEAISELY